MRYQSRNSSSKTGESMAKRSLRPLPCSIRSSMRLESMSDTLRATTSDTRNLAPIGRSQRGLVLWSGCRFRQANDLFLAQHRGYFARLAHEYLPRRGRWADAARGYVAGGAYRGRACPSLSNRGCGGCLVLRRLPNEGYTADVAP